ncbi:hypothetical protein [Acidisoma sp. S159]|uniref:hypothetical protein n=1 Tax=Acidisoma sp. S159 TaxID=1747225 RepID=UPI00352ABF02
MAGNSGSDGGWGFPAVASFNPYWDQLGRTYEDPDGYRVVIQTPRGALDDSRLRAPISTT